MLMALIVSLLTIRTVRPGTVKVVTRWGRVTGRTLEPGIHLVAPIADATLTYDTKKVIYETTTGEKQKGSDADYKDYPVIVTIGSIGEKICYDNSREVLKEYTTQIISYDMSAKIKNIFGNFQFGMFPIFLVEEEIKERKES